MRLSEALRYRAAIERASAALPDEELLEVPNLAPVWDPAKGYEVGDRVSFEGILYRCLQGHQAQPGWTPTAAPSLWARVLIEDPGTVPEWVQPDSTNPYSKGDRVTYQGKTWESTIDGNVWAPGVYGWVEVNE